MKHNSHIALNCKPKKNYKFVEKHNISVYMHNGISKKDFYNFESNEERVTDVGLH